jgi:NAD(P)-dependent dehydrogenase (short-subunit alcohol dehydrogenase family)
MRTNELGEGMNEEGTQTHGLLEGKVAVITGASRGIGAAAARAFADAGAMVALAARDEQALASLVHYIEAAGGQALAVPSDVGESASVERLVAQTVDAYGRLDVAFNNAGGGHKPAPLAELSLEDYESASHANLRGTFLSMKYEIAAMLEGGGGAIVNMSSTAGLQGVRGMGAYSAAKHGIVGLTKSAALDYAELGVRVNVVAPGPIFTHRFEAIPEEHRKQFRSWTPLRRIGREHEVAATAAWLCSDQASFITGATVPIDGGKLAGVS